MRTVRFAHSTAVAAVAVALLAAPAAAFPVAAPFGTFPKAIYFTGATKPASASGGGVQSLIVADGGTGTRESGVIMTPLGDGSWACTAVVYAGSTLNYYFEFRIPEFEPDTTGSYTTDTPGGARNEDRNRNRTVVIPDTATDGYVVYNAYGDRTVWGRQGSAADSNNLSISHPDLAAWRGIDLLTATDADTSGRDEANAFSLGVAQLTSTSARVRWDYSIGGDGLAAHVEGDSRFNGPPHLYGFRVLRAESDPSVAFASLGFTDVTPLVTGSSLWSDDDNDPWNSPITFDDTSVSVAADSVLVYTVLFRNAYGMGNAVADQNFAGGFAEIQWADLAVTVDGTVDLLYGLPLAEDTSADGGGFENLDLTRMWATMDSANYYLALEIDTFISKTTWGFYGIFLDTTGDTAGAPDFMDASLSGSGRKRNARFSGNHLPEYAVLLYSTDPNNQAVNASEVWEWTGGGWTNLGAVDALAWAETAGRSVIEVAVQRARIVQPAPNPARLWLEGFSTGNGNGDTIIDTVNRLEGEAGNDEWNATFQSTAAADLALSTPFPPAIPPPMGLAVMALDSNVFVRWVEPPINPALLDRIEIYLSSDSGAVLARSPAALAATLAVDDVTFETSNLANGTYYLAGVTVSTNGDSAATPTGSFLIETSLQAAVAVRWDSNGITRVEVPKGHWPSSDSFFWISILNFDEIFLLSVFDTGQRALWDKMMTAVEKSFFDPTVEVISPMEYSDTLAPVRQVIVRRPDGTIAPNGYFTDTVAFWIPYRTAAGGEIIEGTPYREDRLVIRKLDEGAEEWIFPPDGTEAVEPTADRVLVVTSDFSIWTLLASAGPISNFDRLVVYPNPFNAREYIAAGHPLPAHVTFAFIPTNTDRVEIFNVAGERVRTLNVDDPSEFERQAAGLISKWDAKNDYGRDVASGVYLFWIRAGGQTKVGKVAVIK